MPSAPAFELDWRPGWTERAACAIVGAATAAAVAAWLGSHLAADTSHGWPSLASAILAAIVGGGLAWRWTPRLAGRIAWHDGRWTLQCDREPALEGSLRPMLDLGSWLLLRFRPLSPGRTRWLGIGRGSAGSAWHPLRATLFAPSRAPRATDEGVRP
jgi:hypothetical protein